MDVSGVANIIMINAKVKWKIEVQVYFAQLFMHNTVFVSSLSSLFDLNEGEGKLFLHTLGQEGENLKSYISCWKTNGSTIYRCKSSLQRAMKGTAPFQTVLR